MPEVGFVLFRCESYNRANHQRTLEVTHMSKKHSLSWPFLLIALFVSFPAVASTGHQTVDFQSQQARALPQSAADWLKLGIELSRTSTNSQLEGVFPSCRAYE
jgi:hypothetical protein